MMQADTDLDLEQVLRRPRSFFAEPKDVVAHSKLSRDDKLAILREWELDAPRLSASEGEGFCGGGREHARARGGRYHPRATTRLSAGRIAPALTPAVYARRARDDDTPLGPHQDRWEDLRGGLH